jgi:hypothetical protein
MAPRPVDGKIPLQNRNGPARTYSEAITMNVILHALA